MILNNAMHLEELQERPYTHHHLGTNVAERFIDPKKWGGIFKNTEV